MQNDNAKIIVIVGPTAVGKSDLAVRLAKRFGGEIISADSRQVYRGLNIGTGKITKREMRGVPHYLIDVANPRKRFSVANYQKLAREKISEIFSRARLPIICGGTGFYIEAVTDGIVLPNVAPNQRLRAKLQKETAETLLNMLIKLDPKRAKTVDPKNPRRIIRAIEIAHVLGHVPHLGVQLPNEYRVFKIGITLLKDRLKQKIHTRLSARLKTGMVAEAKRLHRQGLSWKRMEELGLEYRYVSRYLRGLITKKEMIEKLNIEIWHFARRQMTWWKRDKNIVWFAPTETGKIVQVVKNFLAPESVCYNALKWELS